jgi:hypothetical protein
LPAAGGAALVHVRARDGHGRPCAAAGVHVRTDAVSRAGFCAGRRELRASDTCVGAASERTPCSGRSDASREVKK